MKTTFDKIAEFVAGKDEKFLGAINNIILTTDADTSGVTLDYKEYADLINELARLQGFAIKINRNDKYFIESATVNFLENKPEYDEIY